jgi:type III restriction enzyme
MLAMGMSLTIPMIVQPLKNVRRVVLASTSGVVAVTEDPHEIRSEKAEAPMALLSRWPDYRSKLYHLYQWVKDDLNRKAEPHATLPDLVQNAYYLLGKDWLETLKRWDEERRDTPPVMITVANRTETAARVKHAFDQRKILIEELCAPEKTLHIDSKVLEKAEARDDGLSREERAEELRVMVDTVGQKGRPGAEIQNVISVGMLSEGWDAKTVTHIMGLRAFSSQLLCEQVVGRGLRRTSYDVDKQTGLFAP